MRRLTALIASLGLLAGLPATTLRPSLAEPPQEATAAPLKIDRH